MSACVIVRTLGRRNQLPSGVWLLFALPRGLASKKVQRIDLCRFMLGERLTLVVSEPLEPCRISRCLAPDRLSLARLLLAVSVGYAAMPNPRREGGANYTATQNALSERLTLIQ